MDMPRYSFRLKKEDAELQERIQQGINDYTKSSDVIRELMYKGFHAERKLLYSGTTPSNEAVSSNEVKELKELVNLLIKQQTQMMNEVRELKQNAIISQPTNSTVPGNVLNEGQVTEETVKSDNPLEVTEKEEEMANSFLEMFDQW